MTRSTVTVAVKRAVDLVGAASLLVVLSPLLLLSAVAVRVTSRGPVLFRQSRVGMGGQSFVCVKFRTMYDGVDDESHRRYVRHLLTDPTPADGGVEGVYKLARDERVTPVGRWLRRTSIDELPQLVNVLRGEMSLVGPRPMLAWEADLLEPWQKARFGVKPGLTGLWQVSGRSRVSVRDALELDVQYARSQSLRLDVEILLRTPAAVLHLDDAA